MLTCVILLMLALIEEEFLGKHLFSLQYFAGNEMNEVSSSQAEPVPANYRSVFLCLLCGILIMHSEVGTKFKQLPFLFVLSRTQWPL